MKEKHTILIFTENTPGVLQRITSVFTRRRINIESLTVSETERPEQSQFTVTFYLENENAVKVLKAIQRFVEIISAQLFLDDDLVYREIAFFRVSFLSEEEREKIWNLAKSKNAEILDVDTSSLIIEKSGTEVEINELKKLISKDSLLSFTRSGRIAMQRSINQKISIEKTDPLTTKEGETKWQSCALEM